MNRLGPPKGGRDLGPWRSIRQAFETLLAWLPLLGLGLMLLSTVWLLRTAPPSQTLATDKKPLDIPDYEVRDFSMRVYALNGQLKNDLQGTLAQHFSTSMTTLVQQPRFMSYSTQGHVTQGQAKQALTNEDGSEIQLMGEVRLHRQPTADQPDALTVTSEFLHFYANTDEVKSHVPVQAVQGRNTFKGDNLHADNLNQVIQMRGRVTTVLTPKSVTP